MSKFFSPPYLLPGTDGIEMSPWKLFWNGDSVPLEQIVEGWVTGTDLRLTRAVSIDGAQVRADCGLAPDTPLDIVVSWFGNTAKMRRRVFVRRIVDRHNEIEAVLSGAELGGTAAVTTSLVLGADVPAAPAGAPHLRGSILVRDTVRVMLEGEGSMFPMAVVDFAPRPYENRSSWHVETSTDIDADFSAVFQVLVNEQDVELVKAIEADKPNRRQEALLDELTSGVMQTVLELAYAVKSQGMLGGGFEEGTVGQVLQGLVEQTGGRDIGDLSEPSQLSRRRTVFQAMARTMAAGRVF